MTQYVISETELTDIENRLVIAKGGGGRDGLGVWDQQTQIIIYKIDNKIKDR